MNNRLTTSLRYAILLTTLSAWAPGFAQTPSSAQDAINVCAPHSVAQRNPDVAAICQHGRDWIIAFKAGDIDRLMQLYRPDARVALHAQTMLVGVAAIRAFFAPALAARPDVTFLLHVEDIRVVGDIAYLVSRYWYTSRLSDGKSLQDAGRSVLVYRRDHHKGSDARWKIQIDIDQATPDVSFPAPASAQ